MNKLKIIIAVLAIGSLFFGQCMCPYKGDNPVGSLNSELAWWLINYVYSGDFAEYSFDDDGQLEITNKETKVIQKGFWSLDGEVLTLLVNKKTTDYTVEKISDLKLKLIGQDEIIILVRINKN